MSRTPPARPVPQRILGVLALALAAAPGGAHAFRSSDLGGQSEHDQITDNAARWSVKAHSDHLAPHGERLYKLVDLMDGLEFVLTVEQLDRGHLPLLRARDALTSHLGDVFPNGLYSGAHHFLRPTPGYRSADTLRAGVAFLARKRRMVVADARAGAFGCALAELAMELHTTQDFFANSNFAALAASRPGTGSLGDDPYRRHEPRARSVALYTDGGAEAAIHAWQCGVGGIPEACDKAAAEGLRLGWYPNLLVPPGTEGAAWEVEEDKVRSVTPVSGLACPEGGASSVGGTSEGCIARPAVWQTPLAERIRSACAGTLLPGRPVPADAAYSYACYGLGDGLPTRSDAAELRLAKQLASDARTWATIATAMVLDGTRSDLDALDTADGAASTPGRRWSALSHAHVEDCQQ